VWGASLVGVYPYVGSRHTVFLAPFVIAAASFLLAVAVRQRLWAAFLMAALLMGASNVSAKPAEEMGAAAANQSPALMAAAVNYVHQSIPRGSTILVDFQSDFPIAYYLCGPKTVIPADPFRDSYFRYDCDGYSVISLHIWKLIPENFQMQFQLTAKAAGLKSGERVWVFQSGWGENLGAVLPKKNPKFRCLAPKTFGEVISVVPFVVGPDLSPGAASPGC
ncbi:MAG: hypothetical protein ACRD4Y_05625, partial [Candidatus Acidiferrales bacterium]